MPTMSSMTMLALHSEGGPHYEAPHMSLSHQDSVTMRDRTVGSL